MFLNIKELQQPLSVLSHKENLLNNLKFFNFEKMKFKLRGSWRAKQAERARPGPSQLCVLEGMSSKFSISFWKFLEVSGRF